MLYVENVRLWIPTEGTKSLLDLAKSALCTGCPAGIGAGNPAAAPPAFNLSAALVVNNPPLSCGLTYADLELGISEAGPHSLNAEAPPEYCLDMLEGPGLGGDGLWRLVMDQQIWTWTADDPVSVYGLALIMEVGAVDMILGFNLLANGPASFGAAGDIIKLTAELPLPCVMPPAPEEVPEP